MNPLEGKHIGLIPDGNRRWAKENNKDPEKGHKKGSEVLDNFIDWAIIQNKAEELTVYSLSTQNLIKRSQKEIEYLVDLYKKKFKELAEDERVKGSIKVNFLGDLSNLPQTLKKTLKNVQEKTKDNKDHVINFLLPYGGREEITRAVKKIVTDMKDKAINAKDITEEKIQENLRINNDVDLTIRTTEKRLSNFLPWQTTYSELFFVDKYWPELTEEDFEEIKKEFTARKRTYGE